MTQELEQLTVKYVWPLLLLVAGGIVSSYIAIVGPLPVAFGLILFTLAFAAFFLYRKGREVERLHAELSQAKNLAVIEPATTRNLKEEKPSPPKMAIPRQTLEHVATVTLDTKLEPFDSFNEPFEEGEIIEVDVKSVDSASFHFFMCNDDDFEVNQRRSVNFECYEGKEYTAQFRKQIVIPSSDMWHFIAYTPAGEEYTTVQLKISRVL